MNAEIKKKIDEEVVPALNMAAAAPGTDEAVLEEYNASGAAMDAIGLQNILEEQYLLGVIDTTFHLVRALTEKGNVKLDIEKGKFRSNKKTIKIGPEGKEEDYTLEGQDYNARVTITNIDIPPEYFKLLDGILRHSCYFVELDKGLVATNSQTGSSIVLWASYAGCVVDNSKVDQGELKIIAAVKEEEMESCAGAFGEWYTYLDNTSRFDEAKLQYVIAGVFGRD
jgi:hypothetical protein